MTLLQAPGVRVHIPQIGSGKIFISVVPGQVVVKDRINAQRKRLDRPALSELGKDKLSGGLVRIRIFLFHHNHPGDSLPRRRGIMA